MNLSQHFTLEEAVFSSTATRLGLDNTPTAEVLVAMRYAAAGMELVRHTLGDRPLHIDSWYRCEALNHAVSGAQNSAHLTGYAVDFVCAELLVSAMAQTISASHIKFDQLIYEGTWLHISFAPALRRQILTAHFQSGGTTYTNGIPT